MRIFAVSDLHTDFAENRRRRQELSPMRHPQDVVVVAGDCDQVIDGVRYVHNAFGYPREEEVPKYHLKQIWGADNQNDADQVAVLSELWSNL
jgi:hypothetical protein